MKIAGIYKIVSPTGKVYIGQSYDIHKRWKLHIWWSKKGNNVIYRSIAKHGADSHEFSIIHELPSDVDKVIMTNYEQLYMDQHRESGAIMLNMTLAAGSTKGMVVSEETRRKISESNKGRKPPVVTDATRKKISDALKGNKHTLGRKLTPEQCRAISERQLGKPGKIPNEESRRKMSIAGKGKKKPPKSIETRLNISNSKKGNKFCLGRILSDCTKQKIANSLKGNVPWNKGKTGIYTEETRMRISNTLKNKKQAA